MSNDKSERGRTRRTIGKVMLVLAAALIAVPVGIATYEAVTDRDPDDPLINIQIG